MNTVEKTSTFLSDKPLCFIAWLMAIRDLSVGVGFALNLGGARKSLLYGHYNDFSWEHSGAAAGVLFIIVSLLVTSGLLSNKNKLVRFGLRSSALIWMFAALMYLLFGEWSLALYLGGFMMVLSGFIAYYFKPRA